MFPPNFTNIRHGIGESASALYHKYGLKHCVPFLVLLIYTFVGAGIFIGCERHYDTTRRKMNLDMITQSRNRLLETISDLRLVTHSLVNTTANRAMKNACEAVLQHFTTMLVITLNFSDFYVHGTWTDNPHSSPLSVAQYTQRQLMEKLLTEIPLDRPFDGRKKFDAAGEATKTVLWAENELGMERWMRRELLIGTQWRLWNTMFFAGTIYTTIGYGHFATVTVQGRICTVLYAIVGIPLFLTLLNTIGKLMSKLLRKGWAGACKLYVRAKHRWQHFRYQRFKAGAPPVPQEEEEHRYVFPVWLALGLLLGWVFMCAGIFCSWEHNWDYFTAIYFFFISLTTIGLGDIVPDYPDYMLMLFILIIIGLALVSMCFNIIQMKIEELFEQMLKELEESYLKAMEDEELQTITRVYSQTSADERRKSSMDEFAVGLFSAGRQASLSVDVRVEDAYSTTGGSTRSGHSSPRSGSPNLSLRNHLSNQNSFNSTAEKKLPDAEHTTTAHAPVHSTQRNTTHQLFSKKPVLMRLLGSKLDPKGDWLRRIAMTQATRTAQGPTISICSDTDDVRPTTGVPRLSRNLEGAIPALGNLHRLTGGKSLQQRLLMRMMDDKRRSVLCTEARRMVHIRHVAVQTDGMLAVPPHFTSIRVESEDDAHAARLSRMRSNCSQWSYFTAASRFPSELSLHTPAASPLANRAENRRNWFKMSRGSDGRPSPRVFFTAEASEESYVTVEDKTKPDVVQQITQAQSVMSQENVIMDDQHLFHLGDSKSSERSDDEHERSADGVNSPSTGYDNYSFAYTDEVSSNGSTRSDGAFHVLSSSAESNDVAMTSLSNTYLHSFSAPDGLEQLGRSPSLQNMLATLKRSYSETSVRILPPEAEQKPLHHP